MNPQTLQGLQQQQQNAEEQRKKQEEILERRNVMLQGLMTPEAKERLNRLALVKPEKAKQIEDMLLQNGAMGVYKQKITEEQLIGYLEQLNDEPKTTIQFKRKIEDDDDDDLAGL